MGSVFCQLPVSMMYSVHISLVLLCFMNPLSLALDNGLALTPPMGWLTWERFRCNTNCDKFPDACVSERLMREMAEAMVSEGYANVGYQFIIIDDCWMTSERAADGNLVADPVRFPSGIKNLTAYIHSLGLKFGLYQDVGAKTCAGRPGSQDHYEIDANLFASWEVDYVKIDGCNIDPNDFDTHYPEYGRYLNLTGRPIVYSCEWPLYQWGNKEPDYEAIAKTCNMWRNYYDIDDDYRSVTNIINWHGDNQDKFVSVAGPGAWNDPDMVVVGNFALSFEQSKAQMAIWAIMASPLIMSNDLRNMDPQMKAILQNIDVINVNQDRLAIQGRRIYNNDGIQIWTRPVEPVVGNSTSLAVAVLSTRTDGAPYNLITNVGELGVQGDDRYIVSELFGALTSFELTPDDDLDVLVNPTGVLLLKFQPKENITVVGNFA